MSILKSIMHHFNKTTNSYDTLHPETESAQITDWHSGIMASLASKTLGTVVDAITTDSVLGKLIKMLLDASGVKYLIDTNGYVCFGSFFGGLIIQWGLIKINTNNKQGPHYKSASLPIAVTKFLQGTAAYDYPVIDNGNTASAPAGYSICALIADTTTVTIGTQLVPGYYGDPINIRWIAFFK